MVMNCLASESIADNMHADKKKMWEEEIVSSSFIILEKFLLKF